jgi:hypothetical protein
VIGRVGAAYNGLVRRDDGVLNFLDPMLIEQGQGTSSGWCDRLASDEPEALLTPPT